MLANQKEGVKKNYVMFLASLKMCMFQHLSLKKLRLV